MRTEHFGYSPEDIGKNEDGYDLDYDYDYGRTDTPSPKQFTLMALGVLALARASFLIVIAYPAFVTYAGMGAIIFWVVLGVALIRAASNKIRA